MKQLFLNLTFLIASTVLWGQKTIDAIHLKDGSIYRGEIQETTSESTTINTLCHNTLVFKAIDIHKIETEPDFNHKVQKNKGYYNYTSFGALMGSTANELQAPMSILMENNYRINSHFAVGIVSGIELISEATVPLALNLKVLQPLNSGGTLFIGASAGYSFSVEDAVDEYYDITDSYGGKMALAELGLVFPSNSKLAFFIAAGYRYNELNYKRNDWAFTSVDRTVYYNRISLRVGVSFY